MVRKPYKPEISAVRPDGSVTVGGKQAWGHRTREKIDAAMIVERFQRVALGLEEATQIELNAARMLLDRRLPVIKAIEIAPEGDRSAKSITNTELFNLIEGQCKRIEST